MAILAAVVDSKIVSGATCHPDEPAAFWVEVVGEGSLGCGLLTVAMFRDSELPISRAGKTTIESPEMSIAAFLRRLPVALAEQH